MIKKQFAKFVFRWLLSSVAMFVCLRVFASFKPEAIEMRDSIWFYLVAGLIFSLVNSFVKPLAMIFSLPLIFLTFGVFTVVVNAIMVAITVWILPQVTISFWGAFCSCIVISLINFLVNIVDNRVK